jgi:hypothetical protein
MGSATNQLRLKQVLIIGTTRYVNITIILLFYDNFL